MAPEHEAVDTSQMAQDHSYSFLLGPVVSVLALLMIVLICRWVFSSADRASVDAVRPPDFGLLVPVSVARTREDADMVRDLLREAGIRAGISDEGGQLQVLVFEQDLERARALVGAT